MRHILVHHYFDIDLAVLWGIVEKDIPKLKKEIEILLTKLASSDAS